MEQVFHSQRQDRRRTTLDLQGLGTLERSSCMNNQLRCTVHWIANKRGGFFVLFRATLWCSSYWDATYTNALMIMICWHRKIVAYDIKNIVSLNFRKPRETKSLWSALYLFLMSASRLPSTGVSTVKTTSLNPKLSARRTNVAETSLLSSTQRKFPEIRASTSTEDFWLMKISFALCSH